MNNHIRIVVAIGIAIYFYVIIRLIRKQRLSIRVSLIWFCFGIAFILLDAFPIIFETMATLLGIEVPLNCLLLLAIFVIFITLISLSGLCSRQQDKIRELTQQFAIMEARLRNVESEGKNA